jgi:uncharacterized OB-fold protein
LSSQRALAACARQRVVSVVLDSIALYRPGWFSQPQRGRRRPGPDEDLATMAVAAARAALGEDTTGRVILVSADAEAFTGPLAAVILAALRLPRHTPVELRVGGSPAVVDSLVAAQPGTLVVAVALGAGAGAAAVHLAAGSPEGIQVTAGERIEHGLPVGPAELTEQDPRFFRDRAWKPAITRLGSASKGTVQLVAGLPPETNSRLGSDRALAEQVDVLGAPACLFAIAALVSAQRTGRIICLDGGSAVAIEVSGSTDKVVIMQREQPLPIPANAVESDIPVSLSAYERAFDAKVGLQAGQCECGTLELPPRDLCLVCGRERAWHLEPLPHVASVYSITTVRTPVPGLRTPYSLAVVEIDGVGVRLLTPLTDAVPGSVAIGRTGTLVLRRLTVREGIPDYGYAFQPDEDASSLAYQVTA